MSDSISNFITIIRNASRAGKETCLARKSKVHLRIAEILKEEGYLRDVRESTDAHGHPALVLELKYVDEQPAINEIKRQSKPGRRLYYGANEIPRTLNGLGFSIMTTSKGVMTDRNCRREGVGGEMLCAVW